MGDTDLVTDSFDDADAADADPADTRRRPRRRRRWVLVVLALVVGWIAALTVTLVQAAGHASTGRDLLVELGTVDPLTADLAGVHDDVVVAETELRAADRLLGRPVVAPLSVLPVLGRQLEAGNRQVDASLELTAALRPLLTEILAVQETGAAQLDRIEFLGTLDGHLARLESTMAGVDFGPEEHLFDGLADSRADGVTALAELEVLVGQARVGVIGLRSVLLDGTYLMLIGSPAEMQAAGGMPLSVGRLDTSDGNFVLREVTASEFLLPGESTPVVDPDIAEHWSFLRPGNDFRKLPLTPRFEDYVGPQALTMWQSMTGEQLDGVFAIDPLVLEAVLGVVGDIEVDGVRFGADNVVDYLLSEQYEAFSDADDDEREERRDRLAGIAGQTFEALGSRPWDPVALLGELVSAANGRHILAYSTVAEEQQLWRQVGVAGVVEGDEVLVGLMNLGGNKLDPYINVDVATDVVSTDDGGVELQIGMRLINRASGDLPDYIVGLWEENGALDAGGYVARLVVFGPSTTTEIEFGGDPPLEVYGRDGLLGVAATRIYVPPGSDLTLDIVIRLAPGLDTVTVLPTGRVPNVAWRWNETTFLDQEPRVMALD